MQQCSEFVSNYIIPTTYREREIRNYFSFMKFLLLFLEYSQILDYKSWNEAKMKFLKRQKYTLVEIFKKVLKLFA